MNNSIIAGISSSGYIVDSFVLSGYAAICIWFIWIIFLVARTSWSFLDDDDFKIIQCVGRMASFDKRHESIYSLVYHIIDFPLIVFLFGGIFIVFLHHPLFCLVFVGIVFLMIAARRLVRSYKKIKGKR